MRTELEVLGFGFSTGMKIISLRVVQTRMTHIRPCELLLPAKKLSKPSEKLLAHFTGQTSTSVSSATESTRIERFVSDMDYSAAFDYVSKFYKQQDSGNGSQSSKQAPAISGDIMGASENFKSGSSSCAPLLYPTPDQTCLLNLTGKLFASAIDFPRNVIISLAQTIKYLTLFGLASSLLRTSFFGRFLERSSMLLNANTLSNLFVSLVIPFVKIEVDQAVICF